MKRTANHKRINRRRNARRMAAAALAAALMMGTPSAFAQHGAARFDQPDPNEVGGTCGVIDDGRGGPGDLSARIDRPGPNPWERFSQIAAEQTARTLLARTGIFDNDQGGPLPVVAQAMAADALELGREMADRFGSRASQFDNGRRAQLPGPGQYERARRLLDKAFDLSRREAYEMLAAWTRELTRRGGAGNPVQTRVFAAILGEYVEDTAAEIAASIRAELEDEFGLPRPEPRREDQALQKPDADADV